MHILVPARHSAHEGSHGRGQSSFPPRILTLAELVLIHLAWSKLHDQQASANTLTLWYFFGRAEHQPPLWKALRGPADQGSNRSGTAWYGLVLIAH